MKKLFLFLITTLIFSNISFGQRYLTRSGITSFDAGTGLEDITAINKGTTCIFDSQTGQINSLIQINGFEFKSALMQDHFHENYMETSKYPKSIFKGYITNIKTVNFSLNGSYPITITGNLEMHGITKEVTANGKIVIDHGAVVGYSTFIVKLSDFNISVPNLVGDKLSKTVKITINCTFAKQ